MGEGRPRPSCPGPTSVSSPAASSPALLPGPLQGAASAAAIGRPRVRPPPSRPRSGAHAQRRTPFPGDAGLPRAGLASSPPPPPSPRGRSERGGENESSRTLRRVRHREAGRRGGARGGASVLIGARRGGRTPIGREALMGSEQGGPLLEGSEGGYKRPGGDRARPH